MKKIKSIMLIAIIFIVFTILIQKTYAADESFKLELEASSTTLNPGDSFSVNIIINDINVTTGDQGIGAYQAKITYDKSVLELVGVTQATGWEVLENEGNIVVNTSNAEVVKEKTHTATINFKVLDNVAAGDTTISLESIKGSSGTTTIDGTTISSKINIEKKETDDKNPSTDDKEPTVDDENSSTNDEKPTVEDNKTTENNTINKNQTNISSNTNKNTVGNKVLPHTGVRNFLVIAISIIFVATLVFYIKYKRAV